MSDPVPRPRGQEEKQVLAAYLTEHKLKRSEQRELILDEFLKAKRHVSVDELLRLAQRRRPDIGRTTVYRTLKLRGLNPTKAIAAALRTYVATGQLPPLPHTDIADS